MPVKPPTSRRPVLLASVAELEQAARRVLRQTLFLLVGLYLLVQFAGAITSVLLLFGCVFFIAAALNPAVAWLERRHVPRAVSAAALGLLILGGAAAALWWGAPPLLDQMRNLRAQFPDLWDRLQSRISTTFGALPDTGAQSSLSSELFQRLTPLVTHLAEFLGRYAFSALAALCWVMLLMVLAIYSLASPQPLIAGLLGSLPRRHRARAERILGMILARLKAWALGSLLLGVIVAAMTAGGLYVLGMPFVLLFALIAGIGELLPNLGPILSAIPPLLVALADDPMKAVWVGVLFIAVQQIENHLIVPLVMSRAVDLHPLSVVFAVLSMGALFGLLGAIIAVPTTIIVKTLFQEIYLSQRDQDSDALDAQADRIVAGESC
jgi:putative permease